MIYLEDKAGHTGQTLQETRRTKVFSLPELGVMPPRFGPLISREFGPPIPSLFEKSNHAAP